VNATISQQDADALAFDATILEEQLMTSESELWLGVPDSHARTKPVSEAKRGSAAQHCGQSCLPRRRKRAGWVLELALMCVLAALLPRGQM
jgi:hypothetical protein